MRPVANFVLPRAAEDTLMSAIGKAQIGHYDAQNE